MSTLKDWAPRFQLESDEYSTALKRARKVTWVVACDIAGIHRDVCIGEEIMHPPFCLRILREHRTADMRKFRREVASQTRRLRRAYRKESNAL